MPKNKLHQVDFTAGLLNRKFQNFPEHPIYKTGLSAVENFEFIDDQGLSARRSTRLLGLPTDLKGFKNWLYEYTGTLVGDEYDPLPGFEYKLEQIFAYDDANILVLFENEQGQSFFLFLRWLQDSEKYQIKWNFYPKRYRRPVVGPANSTMGWVGEAIDIKSPTYPTISGTSVEVRPAVRPPFQRVRFVKKIEDTTYLIVHGRFIHIYDFEDVMEGLGNNTAQAWFKDSTATEHQFEGDHYQINSTPDGKADKNYLAPVATGYPSIKEREISYFDNPQHQQHDVNDPAGSNAGARQMWLAKPWDINATYNKGDVVSIRIMSEADFANIADTEGFVLNFVVPEDNYTKIPVLEVDFDRNTIVDAGSYHTIPEDSKIRFSGVEKGFPTIHAYPLQSAFNKGSFFQQGVNSSDRFYSYVYATHGGELATPGYHLIMEMYDFQYYQDRCIVVDENRILISRVGWYLDFFPSTDPDGGMILDFEDGELPVWIADTSYGLLCGTTEGEYILAAAGTALTTTNVMLQKIGNFGSPRPDDPGFYEYSFSYGGGFYFLSKKGLARLVYSQEKQSYDVAIYDLFSNRIVGPMKKIVKDMTAGYVYIQDQEGVKALNFEGKPFANGYDFELDSLTFEGTGFVGEVELFDLHNKAGFLVKDLAQNRPIAFVLEDMKDLPVRCDMIIPETRGDYIGPLNSAYGILSESAWIGTGEYPHHEFIRHTYRTEDKGIIKTDNGDGTTRVDLPDIGLRYDVDASTLGMDANTDWTLKDEAEIILFSTDDDLTEVKIHGTYTDDRKTYDVEHPNVTFLTQTTDWNDGLGLFWVGFNFTSRFKTVPALNLPGTSTTGGKVWIQLFDTLGGKILANDKSYELPLTTEEIAGEEFTGRKSKRVDVSHTEEGIKLGFEAADFRRAHINSLSVEAEIQEDK